MERRKAARHCIAPFTQAADFSPIIRPHRRLRALLQRDTRCSSRCGAVRTHPHLAAARHCHLLTYNADERELYGDASSTPCEPLKAVKSPAALITRILQPGPGIDGIDLTHLIKSSPATASIAIIITTSFPQAEYREAARAAGCDEYLLLPVLPDELVAVMNRVTERRG